jgi:hypothetical protein
VTAVLSYCCNSIHIINPPFFRTQSFFSFLRENKNMSSETTTRVLEALSSLYSSTDKRTSRDASRWLESFQKNVRDKKIKKKVK